MGYREERMKQDDIRCHNREKADIRFHDGALRHVVGVSCYQVVRASKDRELSPETEFTGRNRWKHFLP